MYDENNPVLLHINKRLTELGWQNHNTEDYYKERLEENPAYVRSPLTKLFSHNYINDEVESSIQATNQAFEEQWGAVIDVMDGPQQNQPYGLFDVEITRFHSWENSHHKPHLVRMTIRLVTGEDALDNDEFNNFGRDWKVLWVELPWNGEGTPQFLIDTFLVPFLTSFNSTHYFDEEEIQRRSEEFEKKYPHQ